MFRIIAGFVVFLVGYVLWLWVQMAVFIPVFSDLGGIVLGAFSLI